MAMSAGGGGGSLTNEINVTPMIDVLLVLLIIFMMVVPMARKAIDMQLPDPNPAPHRRRRRSHADRARGAAGRQVRRSTRAA